MYNNVTLTIYNNNKNNNKTLWREKKMKILRSGKGKDNYSDKYNAEIIFEVKD